MKTKIKAYKSYEDNKNQKETENYNDPDIIIEKLTYQETVTENGIIEKKPTYKKVNLTKKINETAKLLKTNTAEEKIKELEKIFTRS